MASNTIEPLTAANGGLACAGALSEEGKELVLERMHSKFGSSNHGVVNTFSPSSD